VSFTITHGEITQAATPGTCHSCGQPYHAGDVIEVGWGHGEDAAPIAYTTPRAVGERCLDVHHRCPTGAPR
jgi:hypothetical protein